MSCHVCTASSDQTMNVGLQGLNRRYPFYECSKNWIYFITKCLETKDCSSRTNSWSWRPPALLVISSGCGDGSTLPNFFSQDFFFAFRSSLPCWTMHKNKTRLDLIHCIGVQRCQTAQVCKDVKDGEGVNFCIHDDCTGINASHRCARREGQRSQSNPCQKLRSPPPRPLAGNTGFFLWYLYYIGQKGAEASQKAVVGSLLASNIKFCKGTFSNFLP